MIKNMEGVFILKRSYAVKDKGPMPADDVFTSGATMMDKCAAEQEWPFILARAC